MPGVSSAPTAPPNRPSNAAIRNVLVFLLRRERARLAAEAAAIRQAEAAAQEAAQEPEVVA